MTNDNPNTAIPDNPCSFCGVDCEHRSVEVEVLRGALRDALALLPPERWRLLLPQYDEARQSAIYGDENDS